MNRHITIIFIITLCLFVIAIKAIHWEKPEVDPVDNAWIVIPELFGNRGIFEKGYMFKN